MQHANAILAISSTDRYIANLKGNSNQPYSNVLVAQYLNQPPYSSDFQITAPNALINGYIDRIIVSQIQLQYYVPTVVPGQNDLIEFYIETSSGSNSFEFATFDLPYGFYSPQQLATMLQVFLNTEIYGDADGKFFVVYNQGIPETYTNIGFTITLDDSGRRFYFPRPALVITGTSILQSERLLKTYKLFGITAQNSEPQVEQLSYQAPTFLYTPYIDIYSDALTNYQKLKDTDSSTSRRKGLVARLYLSGVGNPQHTSYSTVRTLDENGALLSTTTTSNALGAEPFVLTYDLNSPKVINWTPDSAVNTLDFQLRDCYGDLLFNAVPAGVPGTGEVFNTEFQMTLLCIETD